MMSDFMRCPRYWYWRYVHRLREGQMHPGIVAKKREGQEHLDFGHEMAEFIDGFYKSGFPPYPPSKAPSGDHAAALAKLYAKKYKPDDGFRVESELFLKKDFEGFSIVGRLDGIGKDGAGEFVSETKTMKHPETYNRGRVVKWTLQNELWRKSNSIQAKTYLFLTNLSRIKFDLIFKDLPVDETRFYRSGAFEFPSPQLGGFEIEIRDIAERIRKAVEYGGKQATNSDSCMDYNKRCEYMGLDYSLDIGEPPDYTGFREREEHLKERQLP